MVAKNYLSPEELESLGRIVSAYRDLAEVGARRKIPMTIEDWAKRLDASLEFTEGDILNITFAQPNSTLPPFLHGTMRPPRATYCQGGWLCSSEWLY